MQTLTRFFVENPMNWILIALIFVAIASIVQAWILQASFKIVIKDTPTFGNAFKTCFVAQILSIIAMILIALIVLGPDGEGVVAMQILAQLATLIIYVLLISMFIGTDLLRAALIAIVMTVINFLLSVILGEIVASYALG